METNFYVYTVTVGGVLRYIGKGCGGRASSHLRITRKMLDTRSAKGTPFHRRLAAAMLIGAPIEIEIEIVDNGLTEAAAYAVEKRRVAAAGSGLWNTLPGGGGGSSSYSRLLWTRSRFRESQVARWADPAVKARHSAAIAKAITPDHRANFGKRVSASWLDPKKREKRLARLSERNALRAADGLPSKVFAAIQAADGTTYKEIEIAFGRTANRAVFKLKKRGLIVKRGGKHDGKFFTASAEA